MPRRGYDRGTTMSGPIRGKFKPEAQTREFSDIIYRWCPRLVVDRFEDFEGEVQYQDYYVPMVRTNSNADLVNLAGTGSVARAYLNIPRAGVISAVDFVSEDGRTQNGTNYETWTGLNLLGAGTGSASFLSTTAHVNTTDSDAAAINGGTNLTAKVPYSLTLSGTAASLRVAEGDILELTATAASNPAIMDDVIAHFRIVTLPWGMKPRVVRTAGSPLVQNVANSANGEVICQLSATNEVNYAGIDLGNQLVIPATQAPLFSARVKVGTVTTAQDVIIGLATAFNSTLASTSKYLWFRYSASLGLTVEATDGTNTYTGTTATVNPSFTAQADTYVMYTIDMHDLGNVKFYVNDNSLASVNLSSFASTDLLQPMIGIRKASGTGTVSITTDWVRWNWVRF